MTEKELELSGKLEKILGKNVEGMRFVDIMAELVEVIENGNGKR